MEIPVLLPKIFNYPLTYNSKFSKPLKPGDLVIVPFGKEKEVGVVWDRIHKTSKNFIIKDIEEKIENFSIKRSLIDYINWFSLYNLTSRGLVLKMSLGDKSNFLKLENIKYELNKIQKSPYNLNLEQKNSLKDLRKNKKSFNVTVLQGTTGSGKTLVYFERIKDILKENKQALVLFPEIFLTNQFKNRFKEFFGFEPSIWHSKITPKTKRKILKGINKDKIKIVVGARSALLLPFKNLGLIVVDEEHDSSYKQDEKIIYNARDMAISRASFEEIPINLVTSIPSLETYNNIKKKKYFITKIKKRFNSYPLPETKIINLNISKLNKNRYISDETLKIVNNYLDNKKQALFFLNRRGYAPFLICKNCGFKHTCPNCSIYLTLHRLENKLLCHHCGLKMKKDKICRITKKNCDFILYGPGVEKIYEELKIIYPNKNIKIFSSDFLVKKKQSENILKKIENNEINILVGTQMISKGFNFLNLNCIVVIDADFSGKGYDLRSSEKNIQLYHQLSGRAGRFSKDSIVIYQTMTPSDQILNNLMANDSEKFLNNELIIRKKNNLPPFKRLISIIISSKQEILSLKGAQEIKKKFSAINNLEILGPVAAPISKIKKFFRTRLLLRFSNEVFLQKKLANFLENIKISKKIKLTVDVDPINFD